MKESVDQLVSMWAPRWPLHNGAIYEVQSQDRPNWFSRPRGRSQSTRKRQHGCHAQPPAPPFQRIPEPMITGCKYDGKPGWQHIPRMSQEVDLWWAILEHGEGGSEDGTWALSHRMSQEVELVEYILRGGGSVCEEAVENETKQLSSWEAETICISLRKYFARPAISTLAGDKLTFMFWWQMFLFTSSFSVTDQPRDYHAWFRSLKHLHRPLFITDRNVLSTSTRSTENSLSVVTTYFRTLSAKSIVPVWGDQLSWKPDWGAFCFCHHRHDHHHHYLDFHQLFGS